MSIGLWRGHCSAYRPVEGRLDVCRPVILDHLAIFDQACTKMQQKGRLRRRETTLGATELEPNKRDFFGSENGQN